MEIIEKSNLKTKALVIILIATVMLGICAFFSTVKAAEEPKLNTKIEFTGKTYKYPNQDKVRKEYADGEKGCGIISIISKRAKHTVYVTGEGWIDANQIVSSTKYITISFEKIENGLNSNLKIDGEFLDVNSNNPGIIKYDSENKTLVAGINDGKTTVTFTKKDGTEIPVLATVVDGNVSLNIEEKLLTGEISAEAKIAEKITVEANGGAGVALEIDSNGINVAGLAEGDAVLKVDEKEIASASGNVNGDLTANKEGITAEAKGSQKMTLLQKLTFKLSERANAKINKEKVEGSVGGDVAVDDKELASGDAGLSYNYGDEDPKADLKAEVLEKEVINIQDRTVPVVSMFKKLISKIRAR